MVGRNIRGLIHAKRSLIVRKNLCVQLSPALRCIGTSNCLLIPKSDKTLYSTAQSFEIPQVRELVEEKEDFLKQDEGGRNNDELLEKLLVGSLKAITGIYDLVTLPVYAYVQRPWQKLQLHKNPKGQLTDENRMIYETTYEIFPVHKELISNGIDTYEKLFAYSVTKYGNKKSLGTREILSECEVEDPQAPGKTLKKYDLGNYSWKSYIEVDREANILSYELSNLGLGPKDKIAIFAETQEKWLIAAMACFKRNITIVTLFTALHDDGAVHGLVETGVSTLITSEELMPRCADILKKVPHLKNLIYIDKTSTSHTNQINFDKYPKSINIQKYSDLVTKPEGFVCPPVDESIRPKPLDSAIIMYTSGSTGVPKGVILSHKNMISGLIASIDIFAFQNVTIPTDRYIAYLPLAHVMELQSEAICLIQGVPIGYSSPLTLTDKSLGVKDGCKGDAAVLQPTLILAVPLVIERICRGIQAKVSESSKIAQILFNFFYNYKVNWISKGYDTPLVNKIFFSKIRELVGGKLRFVVAGGAPLASQTHEYFRTVLCAPVCLGYGMTESCAIGTIQHGYDLSVGRVGGPIRSNVVRIIDWEEGNYSVRDKPYPRGEIVLGGDSVAMGYFMNPKAEDFYYEDGKRWIKTGDIAEIHPDGAFKIIDRKKDLVKLSSGEYLSLGKIESALKSLPFCENICVISDTNYPYPVAIMVPNHPYVQKFAEEKLGLDIKNFKLLCMDRDLQEALLQDLQKRAKDDLKLEKNEIPQKIYLVNEPWMPQGGLVTPSLKIKRANITKTYSSEIQEMFERLPLPHSQCKP